MLQRVYRHTMVECVSCFEIPGSIRNWKKPQKFLPSPHIQIVWMALYAWAFGLGFQWHCRALSWSGWRLVHVLCFSCKCSRSGPKTCPQENAFFFLMVLGTRKGNAIFLTWCHLGTEHQPDASLRSTCSHQYSSTTKQGPFLSFFAQILRAIARTTFAENQKSQFA